jgi:hypothetical protein
LSIAAHIQRDTFRPDRHGSLRDVSAPEPVSESDRRRTLKGLRGDARKLADRMLSEFLDWDSASLELLRSYVLSVERIKRYEDAGDVKELRKEVRTNDLLRKALALERPVR